MDRSKDYEQYTLGYGDIVLDMGVEILTEAEEDNYQGSSLYTVYRDGEYGYLEFGWGSCSGCDALQAARSWAEIDELKVNLYTSIEWYPTLEAYKQRVNSIDFEGRWVPKSLSDLFLTQVEAL